MASSKRRRRSAIDRALFHMRPNRIAARAISGGRHQTFGAIAKSPFKSKTVHTPKSGRRAYQQRMARERKQVAAEVAKQRKQAAADQKAARAQIRAQQPRAPRPRQAPIAVNPQTGQPITLRQAEAEYRKADRRAQRLADRAHEEILFDEPVRTRRPRAPKPEPTPLQRAVAEAKKNQPKPRKAAAKKPAARKPTKPKTDRRKVQPLAPVLAGSPPPKLQRPGRNLAGIAMAVTCACRGTGRVIVYDKDGNPNGSTSCPEHGRAGARRGAKRLTTKRAIRDSGLPGLAKWLDRRKTKKRGNADDRQLEAKDQARRQIRHAGPTRECPRPTCEGGLIDKWVTLRLRKQHEDDARTDAARLVRAAEAHNARVRETGDGKEMKVPKMPDERRLRKASRLEFPHSLCPTCGGLDMVETSARLMQDGEQPVAEWRAGAGLKKGHRQTARERATGKRRTKNARRVERGRGLPPN